MVTYATFWNLPQTTSYRDLHSYWSATLRCTSCSLNMFVSKLKSLFLFWVIAPHIIHLLDVSIDVPDTLDLSELRGAGQQPGEELLPEVAPPPLMTPDVEVKGILGSHGNEEDDSLYSPLLCQSVCLFLFSSLFICPSHHFLPFHIFLSLLATYLLFYVASLLFFSFMPEFAIWDNFGYGEIVCPKRKMLIFNYKLKVIVIYLSIYQVHK